MYVNENVKIGTPFILFSESKLLQNLSNFKQSLKKNWPNFQIAYSVKTNPILGICKILINNGCWMEITSTHEMALIELCNTETPLIFNGVYKSNDDIVAFAKNKGIFNIDGWSQIDQFMQIPEEKRPKTLGIRLTPTFIKDKSAWDKFGISIDDTNILATIEKLQKSGNSTISCLHCHVGTNLDELIYYQTARFLAEKTKFFEKMGVNIEFIDIGGGFLKANNVKTVNKYITNIISGLQDGGIDEKKTIVIEPGRGLVENAASLFTKVIDIRLKPKQDLSYLIVDSGVNMIMGVDLVGSRTITRMRQKNREDTYQKYNVFGSLCSQNDIFARDIILPSVKIGDILEIHNVGAYDISTAYNFSQLQPPVYLQKENGEIVLLRKGETTEHVLELESF